MRTALITINAQELEGTHRVRTFNNNNKPIFKHAQITDTVTKAWYVFTIQNLGGVDIINLPVLKKISNSAYFKQLTLAFEIE